MKYILYRSFGDLDKAVKKHELVAVETGKNIDDVTDALIKAAADDLAGMPEYERCETAAKTSVIRLRHAFLCRSPEYTGSRGPCLEYEIGSSVL